MKTIDKGVMSRIRASGNGHVFSPAQFRDLGNRSTVGVGVHRLVKAGKIRRIRRGLYDLPRPHPITGLEAQSFLARQPPERYG